MKIIRAKDYQDMSRKAANIISAQVIMNRTVYWVLPPAAPRWALMPNWWTGTTKAIWISPRSLLSIWTSTAACPRSIPRAIWYFMNENLFSKVNIDPAKTNLPDGTNMDAAAECARYDAVIHNVGGIDLQLLGIGNDGHIGFNEPNEAFELGTHCVDLKEETIEANKRFFDGNADLVPKQAYTMGIKTIMQARKVLMVANGKGKADIVKKAFFGPVTPEVPASILQMHPDFILVGDEEALSEI